MAHKAQDESKQYRLAAGIACLALGAGLVLWGVAPALTFRMATGRQPPPAAFVNGLLSVGLGLTCVLLQTLVNGRSRWPLWTALGLGLMLLTGAVAATIMIGGQFASTYIMFLAGGVVLTAWLALDRTKPAADAPPTPET